MDRTLAGLLKEKRVAAGMSQAALCESMRQFGHRWHPAVVSRTESAERVPTVPELVDLADVFGSTPGGILAEAQSRAARVATATARVARRARAGASRNPLHRPTRRPVAVGR